MRTRISKAGAFIGLVLAIRPATALDPNTRITQYGHSAWRLQDGAFDSAPNAIAQTTDGYLWIATGSGLVKFDGVHFIPWTPPPGKTLPSPAIYSLQGSSDGTLWIGTGTALLSWKGSNLQEHVRGRITSIIQDHKGRIWATRTRVPPDSTGGLCRVVGDHPGCVGRDERMRLPYAEGLAEDVYGNLWVGSGNQVLRWKDTSFEPYLRKELEPFNGQAGVNSIAAGVDGSVWAAIPIEGIGLYQFVHGIGKKVVLAGIDTAHITVIFTDGDSSLWMGTLNEGIYRIYGKRVDHFGAEDGLSSNSVSGFFQDREGTLWVATSKGLDRFRDNGVVTFSTREGLTADGAMSVLATDDGKVLIGNDRALDILNGDKVSSIPISGRRVTSLLEDHAKQLWVGVDNVLAIYEHGQFRKINRPDGSPLGVVEAITEDREQNVWASVTGTDRKVFRIRDGRVQEQFTSDEIPHAGLLAAGTTGGIWLGFANGDLGHYQGAKLQIISLPGDRSGALPGLTIDADGSAWAATRAGMVHWKEGEIRTLGSKNGLPCDLFYSSIQDNQGTLWICAKCGLIGIPDSELKQWWQQPDRRIQFQVLDVLDGAIPGRATFAPALSKSPDGRLWFVNDAVLQMIDPAALRKSPIPPPVYIEQLRADRKDYAMGGFVRLPARSRDIEIGYTALSLAIPERVRFRYKLDERDAEWQEAGTRREAFYSDLAPGRYHFHVSASNNEGVWNEQGAALNFSIDPAYYQTNWFRLSVIAAVLGLLAALYRLRLQYLKHQFNVRLEARVGERTRIARELHDTLLQNFQATLLKFQALSYLLPDHSVAKTKLENGIEQARAAITEGRDAVQDLRSSTVVANDLARDITSFGQGLAADQAGPDSPEFGVYVEGESKDLPPLVRDEVYKIARECLRNAFRHAQAQRIEVQIRYDPRQFRLHIVDNGKGIDPEVLSTSGRAGHHGFPGIHERAELAGAKLSVSTKRDSGTEIELTIPASIAYAKSPHGRQSMSSGTG